ncbi:MAG: PHP domain-containing protein [Lachnospiraceae bacterium]|nr:PHP domain-containing protein [Lachnospiraceae bacterium]
MKADLHTHTSFSDGFHSVKDLIDLGKKIGLDYMAITDHDTTAGLITAMTYGKQIGMNIIPGVEFSTRNYDTGRAVHILCYYPGDLFAFQEFLDKTLAIRYEAKMKTAKLLTKDFPVTMEDFKRSSRESESLYDPHLMIPFHELGYTDNLIGDFFKTNASSKSSRYFTIPYPDVHDALDIIDQYGGVPVIAHPGEYDSLEITEQLAREGRIKGIEYNHPRNTEHDKKEILRIAQAYDLFLTGGTDFHGPNTKTVHPLGSYLCPEYGLKKLLTYRWKEKQR